MQNELETIQQIYNVVTEFIINYSFQIVGAFIILIIGAKLASWLGRLVAGLCEKKNIDITLSRFLGSVVKILVLTFVVIIAIGKFGISIAPFIAALGALAFGASYRRLRRTRFRCQFRHCWPGIQLRCRTGHHPVPTICDWEHNRHQRCQRCG